MKTLWKKKEEIKKRESTINFIAWSMFYRLGVPKSRILPTLFEINSKFFIISKAQRFWIRNRMLFHEWEIILWYSVQLVSTSVSNSVETKTNTWVLRCQARWIAILFWLFLNDKFIYLRFECWKLMEISLPIERSSLLLWYWLELDTFFTAQSQFTISNSNVISMLGDPFGKTNFPPFLLKWLNNVNSSKK